MNKFKRIKRIILTGAESTGKSTLAKQLSKHYNTVYMPEYARTYIEYLNRAYNYDDVVHIAQMQIQFEQAFLPKANKYLFIDTGLIITKVWFQEVFQKYPDWLDDAIIKYLPDFYLICDIDLPWKEDTVRENGSLEKRKYLMNKYIEEIKKYKVKYGIVRGQGDLRLKNAMNLINF
ncbi:MAG: ATP-binding protein [Bacteroidales bacterium]|nr:ATP-binding protein [Bacteroidales bacterium]